MNRLFLIVLAISCINSGYSQDISATLTPTTILIGDHLELELRAKSKAGSQIIFPIISDSTMGNFRLVEKHKTDTLYSGQSISISQKYTLICFEDSLQIFPSLKFANGLNSNYTTPAINLMVNTINVDSAKDIRPIKDVIQVPLSKKELASYLFISFILLGLILLLYYVYIKWIRKESLFDKEKEADPPHIVALKSLKQTEQNELWQKGKVKEYYDEVSDIIRAYIEKRFGIKALEQTTPQILLAVSKLELPEEIEYSIDEILKLADLAKFAKQNPDQEDNKKIMSKAYELIQQTQMIYDANKKADASKVRKFYAQNKYRYKIGAINQSTFRILIYGIMATMLLLSLTILLAYFIPINSWLVYIADSPLLFFSVFILLGSIATLLISFIVRKKLKKFLLVFDYDSLIIKQGESYSSVLFKKMAELKIDKKGRMYLKDRMENEFIIPKDIEYFDEVKERLEDIIDIELNSKEI